MSTVAFAAALVAARVRQSLAATPKGRDLARVEVLGMTRAADALGLALSPAHLETTLIEATNAVGRPRPHFDPLSRTSGERVRAWDDEVARELVRRMGWTA